MADSNKILTVSYGTFSCTLEGFDDAFTTMKAIAEYFRDLAADDRFFGAEPPTPDAEMLARLASRTASRRVEAHQDENGITLRQDTAALSAPARAEPDVDETAEPTVAEVEEALDAAPVAEAMEEAAEDHVEDLSQVADAPVEAAEDEIDEVDEDFAEVEAIAEAEEEATVATPRPVIAKNMSATVRRQPKASPAPRIQPNRPRVQVTGSRPVRVTTGAPGPAPHPDQTSVAAKLARIRGVVAKTGKGEATNGYSEDQHAEGNTPSIGAQSLAEAFKDDLADDAVDTTVEPAKSIAAATQAAIAAELAERDADTTVETDDAEDFDLSAAMDFAESEEDDEAGYTSDEYAADEDTAEVAVEDDADADEEFDEEAFFADMAEDDADDEGEFEAADEVEVAEAPVQPRPVARVLKVKRRHFEAAVEDGTLEEEAEASVPDAILRGESSLSPEDEADLQDELQALEAEIALGAEDDADAVEEAEEDDSFAAYAEDEDEDDADLDPDLDEDMSWDFDDESGDDGDLEDQEFAIGADTEVAEAEDDLAAAEDEEAIAADAEPVQPSRSRLLRKADDDMDRILKETDHHLDDSDGTRRRSAIAHLRAAVAATKAEKQAGGVAEDDEQEVANVYRDDLAQVVRPRRPVTPTSRGESPSRRAEDRPAPLKLVAEQRVDIPGADAGPVRPRRVRMSDLAKHEPMPDEDADVDAQAHARAAAANAASFNEFAERVGAAGLPDLLEAAASYLSFVEGRDQFTRPQLMVKARQALEDEFSREDGLRHFGRLLREGKLRKVSAGHFTVSDRISFRPEERAAG
ncbi:hypothetical protein [Pseudooceanicola sp.]|uniref:hypothetical protein n=1 Tax=Pseudooceanicola sp. TaxID=1914328 RepID=UPI0035C71451